MFCADFGKSYSVDLPDHGCPRWVRSKEALVAQDKPLVIKSGSGTFVTDIRSSAGERALTSSRAR